MHLPEGVHCKLEIPADWISPGVFFCAGRHQDAIFGRAALGSGESGSCCESAPVGCQPRLVGAIAEARAAFAGFTRRVPNASLQTLAGSLANVRDSEQSKILEVFRKLGLE